MFGNTCVSTGSHYWLGPTCPNTHSSSPAPEFLPELKEKEKKKKGESYHSLCAFFLPLTSLNAIS